MLGMPLYKLAVTGMHGQFGRGKGKNQPAASGIDGAQIQNILQEGTVRLGILTVE